MARHEEWELMYARGLTIPRIAALCHAPVNTVRHYLHTAVQRRPSLGQDHQANQPDAHRPSPAWRNKLKELEAFCAANGRFPWTSRTAPDTERHLGRWLIRQRRSHHNGTLSEAQANALDRLGDWITPERQRTNDQHWHHQLTALAAFIQEHGRMPRYQRYASEHEHQLGVWLHVQHQNRTEGKLQASRQEALDTAAPGWRSHE